MLFIHIISQGFIACMPLKHLIFKIAVIHCERKYLILYCPLPVATYPEFKS